MRIRWLLTLVMVSFAWPAAAAIKPPADLVLWHGRIITMDPADSVVEAVAVGSGRILAVGSDRDIARFLGPHTRRVDLKGHTVTPGLIDTHAHISSGGLGAVYSVDLSDATSIEEVVRRVAARAKTLNAGEWLTGSGWDEGKLRDGRYVEARDLDAVTPRNPVWLEHTTGHYGVANSRALELAKLGSSSRDPVAGTIERRPDGSPTGVLKEGAQDLVTTLIPEPTRDMREQGILASLALMHREGMTGVKDPAIESGDWDAYVALAAAGRLKAHVCVLWHSDARLEHAEALAERVRQLPKPPATVAGADLMSCGIKIFMDGSGGGRTAWMYDDWNRGRSDVDRGNHGYPLVDPDVFVAEMKLFHGAGLHVGTHAIGDRAIDWVVDTYASVLADTPTVGLRHSIIHANVPSDHAIDQMARLQREFDAGFPESQGGFTWWIGDNYAGNFGAARSLRLNPFRTYLARGIRWGGGSDYDVTPLPARFGLWATVVREPLLGTYGTHPFGLTESVDVHAALRSYTTWAAHQLFLDHETGAIEVGKSADMAVWDRDVYRVPAAMLRDMHCELTMYRGEIVYRDQRSPVTVSAQR
jgi:predicted amidohydrolase YtcJ